MTNKNTLRIAAAQYAISYLHSKADFEQKLLHLVKEAVDQGAELLMFPEYASMELVSLLDKDKQKKLRLQIEAMQDLLLWYQACYRKLAKQFNVMIVAGSFPVRVNDSYHNRAYVFSPECDAGFQDKLKMTRFEKELWHISAGNAQTLFEHKQVPFGICLCYDVEFPLVARTLIQQGAVLLLAPSCTDGLAGYNRVFLSCRARALENQCYVVQSATVGEAEWSLAVDSNTGAAGVFGPVDKGFPEDGVIAIGVLNQPQWVYADINAEAIMRVRKHGQVLNHRDW